MGKSSRICAMRNRITHLHHDRSYSDYKSFQANESFQQQQTRKRLMNLQTFKALSVMMTEIMRVTIIWCYRRWWLNINVRYNGRPSFFCGVTWRRLAVGYWRFGQPFEQFFENNTVNEVFYCLTVAYRAHRLSRNIVKKLPAYVAADASNLAEYNETRSFNKLYFCVCVWFSFIFMDPCIVVWHRINNQQDATV
jgi:hypothetical protein